MNKQEYERKRFLQNLMYGLSHEFGASLRHVVQFSDLLQRQAGSTLDEKQNQWLQFIAEGGRKAQKMIEALLEVSRISNATHRTLCHIPSLIESVWQNLASHSSSKLSENSKKSKLLFEREKGIHISVCEAHLKIAFFEILSNAILFHPTESSHQPDVVITMDLTETTLCIRIEDNGIGVPEKDWERLGIPFKQLSPELNPEGFGMGIFRLIYIANLHSWSVKFGASRSGGFSVNLRIPTDLEPT